MQKPLLLNIHYALIERHASGEACRRVSVSASGEARLLFDTADCISAKKPPGFDDLIS
jgi:hypothetical protein